MTEFLDAAINFAKDKIDKGLEIWEGFDENQKKLLIGCAIAAVSVILIASIAYGLGKSHGRKIALEEDF
ncbi:MAG: hypothetical protein E7304_10350 [Butyrivibrio sp.]|jgi:hypothetical protein|uniref:hypothetical protein n=1 Tax=Butyrivibrio sp. TaxID=28121 RepID=UPI001EC58621|nr:hypothetical protein [Butyrivibrio sp.]MBE5841791.1 hypothetical protein [Butyrivibrio sp.]